MKKNLLFLCLVLLAITGRSQSISGPSGLCISALPSTYSGTPAGGTWSCASPIVTINTTTGVASGISLGATTITYTLPTTAFATYSVTVYPTPATASLSGSATVCAGSSTPWSATLTGGTWSSSNPAVASVSSSGLVSGYVAGTATISYILTSGTCTSTATGVITVLATPTITTASSQRICVLGTINHTSAVTGGTWTSSITAVGTVNPTTGVVTGINPGTVNITYTLPSGCYSFVTDTVVATPSAIGGTLTTCVGSSTTLTNAVSGGIWASTVPGVGTITTTSGVATGVTVGTTIISYVAAPSCATSAILTVNAVPTASLGSPTICVGATTPVIGSPSGGFWTSSLTAVAAPGMSGITGMSTGAATITYTFGGCYATTPVTVMPTPAAISGIGAFCIPGPITGMSTPAGGVWSSSAPTVVSVAAGTGVLTGLMGGSAVITYTLPSGCYATAAATAMAAPTLTVTATPDACGNGYTLNASGGTSYTWSPSGSLSCASCSSPTTSPTGPITYTALDYSTSGCGATATVTLSGNRIYGHIAFSGMPPASPAMLVWLIQYNSSDSSITALDSVATCVDGGFPFYKFDGKPAGNYLVKARLNSSIPGTSDYIPTYGASTPNWFSAATIAHAAATDVQDITMIYGTVPAGPGFIGGYVYSGAGKGTAGEIPVEGMIVYLKNTAGDVLTYTYTNASGAYSFGSLAYGSYVIYPAEQSYYTTPSTTITLSAANPSAAGVTFKQYTTSGVILPWSTPTSTFTASLTEGTVVYPNPATGSLNISTAAQQEGTITVSLTDVTGRIVFTTQADVNIKGQGTADVSTVSAGIYMVRITSGNVNYTGKLLVQH